MPEAQERLAWATHYFQPHPVIRWINCPPSAKLCENCEDQGSEYAQQGTDAHSLCQYKVESALGMDTADPTESLSFFDEEMENCAEAMPSM